MPISSTSTSVSAGAPRIVTGRPCSLLKLRSFAVDPASGADGGAHEVLRARLADAARDADDGGVEAAARPRRQRHQRGGGVGDLDDRDRRVDRPGRERRRGAACGGRGDEVVAVARGDERHEQLARAQRAGVERGPVDLDVGARAACRRWPQPRRTPGSSSRRTVPSTAWPRTGSTSSCCSAGSPPSTTSAASPRRAVLGAADPQRYRITPIGISREGEWALADGAQEALAAGPARAAGPPRPGGRGRQPRRRPGRRRAASARSCCRCCTARWARTARCRACSSWPTWRTSGAACSARRWRWTRRWPSRCWRANGIAQARYRAFRDHERTPGLPERPRRRARPAVLREAGEHGLVGRRHQGAHGRGAARRHRRRPDLRRVGRRRGGRRRPGDRGRRARQHRARRRRAPARSCPAPSSTTTRTSTSPTAPSC